MKYVVIKLKLNKYRFEWFSKQSQEPGYECIGIERQQNDISRYPPAAKNGETLK